MILAWVFLIGMMYLAYKHVAAKDRSQGCGRCGGGGGCSGCSSEEK